MFFSITGAHVCVVLILFYPFVGVGTRSWVVDTTKPGPRPESILRTH